MGDLVIEQCLPSQRSTELLDLFGRAGRPEFSSVYETVYRPRESAGLKSWVGTSDAKAVLHISVTPLRFFDGNQALTGGMLADLMADESHRDFWNPIKLVRKMVADVRQQRMADFLFTTTVAAAKGVFRAAGFEQFALIRRYVMPLRWPYPLLRRLQHGQRRPTLTALAFDDSRVPAILQRFRLGGFFRPVPDADYYGTRMPRWSYPAGTWLIEGEPEAPQTLVLVSPTTKSELSVADILARDDSPRLAGVMSAVAKWGASRGFRQMSLSTIEGSRVADLAVRTGFIGRDQAYGFYVLPLNKSAELPPSARWLFTPFVLSAW